MASRARLDTLWSLALINSVVLLPSDASYLIIMLSEVEGLKKAFVSSAVQTKRLSRIVDDLREPVTSIVTQTRTQDAKLTTCEEQFASLLSCGALQLPSPEMRSNRTVRDARNGKKGDGRGKGSNTNRPHDSIYAGDAEEADAAGITSKPRRERTPRDNRLTTREAEDERNGLAASGRGGKGGSGKSGRGTGKGRRDLGRDDDGDGGRGAKGKGSVRHPGSKSVASDADNTIDKDVNCTVSHDGSIGSGGGIGGGSTGGGGVSSVCLGADGDTHDPESVEKSSRSAEGRGGGASSGASRGRRGGVRRGKGDDERRSDGVREGLGP